VTEALVVHQILGYLILFIYSYGLAITVRVFCNGWVPSRASGGRGQRPAFDLIPQVKSTVLVLTQRNCDEIDICEPKAKYTRSTGVFIVARLPIWVAHHWVIQPKEFTLHSFNMLISNQDPVSASHSVQCWSRARKKHHVCNWWAAWPRGLFWNPDHLERTSIDMIAGDRDWSVPTGSGMDNGQRVRPVDGCNGSREMRVRRRCSRRAVVMAGGRSMCIVCSSPLVKSLTENRVSAGTPVVLVLCCGRRARRRGRVDEYGSDRRQRSAVKLADHSLAIAAYRAAHVI
jgi:hypothetical protein